MKRALERDDRGFTLVEMVVVVGLLMVILVPVFRFFDSITQKEADSAVAGVQQNNVRFAIDGMLREIRQANSGTATPPIEAIGPQTITFLSPNRASPYRMRRIQYQVVGGNLQRRFVTSTNSAAPWTMPSITGVAWNPVVQRVQTPIFTFLTEAGTTAVASNVARIVVTLRIDPTSTARAPGVQTYKTTVDVRRDPDA